MRCVQATKKIHLYIDNRLSLYEMRALEAHLAFCTSCCQELMLLEEVTGALTDFALVSEPVDMTASIMRRVAQDVEARELRVREEQVRRHQAARHEILRFAQKSYALFRLSLQELLVVLVLASVTTLGIILTLPPLRAILPFTNGNDPIFHLIGPLIHVLATMNSGTLTWMFWIVGALIGVSITLALAGDEMRRSWFKAMSDRFPVW